MSPRLAIVALIPLLALTGCSATSSQNASDESDTETRTPKTTLVAPTATITANQVTLTTDRSTYAPGDFVRATIANGRSASIYATAFGANCTALAVQMKTAAGWQAAYSASCNLQPDLDTLEIKPGGAITMTIPAPGAGTYRCALQYTTIQVPPPRSAPNGTIVSATNPTSGPGVTVYSGEWEVIRRRIIPS
jgi:hypothetical protein